MMSHQSHLVKVRRVDSQIQKFQRQLKKIKYPVLAIQPAQQLSKKISSFKNQKLQNQMTVKLCSQKNLNAYRKIRGDGNCFFRALAYSYLSKIRNLQNVKETFYQLPDIKLTICNQESIPKQFKPYYKDETLKQILINNWSLDVRHLTLSCRANNKRILSRLFRKYPYLDFIVVLYFRSLCLKGLQRHKQEVKQFMKGTQQQEIKTYGQESQGVILDVCSRYLKVSIDVYQVRKQELKHYTYKNQKLLKDSISVSLLYYQNHYDIIQQIDPKSLAQQRQDTKITQDQYYSKVNQNMKQGQCIECQKVDYIYQDNFLCDHCFQLSKNQLMNTVKGDKWVRGVCRDCGRSGLKVLQFINMCEECVLRQSQPHDQYNNKSSYTSKNSSVKSPKKAKYYCKRCNNQLNQNEECQICEVGICLQCERKRCLYRQTKLCHDCKQMQQKVLKRQERKQQQAKNICPNCHDSFRSAYHQYKCIKNFKKQQKKQQVQQMCLQCHEKITSNFHQKACIQRNKCEYCQQAKSSQIHQIKCIKKLTAGRIGSIPKNQKSQIRQNQPNDYNKRKCRYCDKLNLNQILVNGMCKKCRQYLETQDKHRYNTRNQQKKLNLNNDWQLGSQINAEGQICRGCKKVYRLHKLQNGLCGNCLEKSRGVRF